MKNTTGNLTDKEVTMLRKIQVSEYHNGANPINNPVWLSCVARTQSDGGIITSLQSKGLIGLQAADDLVWLTMAGGTFLMLAATPEAWPNCKEVAL